MNLVKVTPLIKKQIEKVFKDIKNLKLALQLKKKLLLVLLEGIETLADKKV